jgi:hypothetical protein
MTVAELSTKQRDRLKSSQFAYVDKKGEEHLPINDDEHIRNALARFNQTDFESTEDKHRAARKIMTAAHEHDIEVDADTAVARAAKS